MISIWFLVLTFSKSWIWSSHSYAINVPSVLYKIHVYSSSIVQHTFLSYEYSVVVPDNIFGFFRDFLGFRCRELTFPLCFSCYSFRFPRLVRVRFAVFLVFLSRWCLLSTLSTVTSTTWIRYPLSSARYVVCYIYLWIYSNRVIDEVVRSTFSGICLSSEVPAQNIVLYNLDKECLSRSRLTAYNANSSSTVVDAKVNTARITRFDDVIIPCPVHLLCYRRTNIIEGAFLAVLRRFWHEKRAKRM